jgi:Leucine-rich repeat (LRR) protein
MWKVFSLLLLLPVFGQSALVTARCRYYDHQILGYTCEVADLQFMAGDELQIAGIHMPGRDNGNVLTVEIVNSTVEVVPQQFFIQFSILRRFNAQNVGMSVLNRIRNCQTLQSLSLSHNKLDIIRGDTFADCTNLLSINLQNNLISNVERWALRGLSILETFNLNNNQMAALNADLFTPTPNILDIGLSNNLLSTLILRTFTPTPFLETLRLSNNNLTLLNGVMFQNLTQLQVFLLNGNNFDNFQAGFFRNLTNLRHLNIDNNAVS